MRAILLFGFVLGLGCSEKERRDTVNQAEDMNSPAEPGDRDTASDAKVADRSPADIQPSESIWTWPVAADGELQLRLNDTFGPRILTSQNRYDFHRGIDISRAVGTPVFAIAAGEVSIAGSHPSYRDLTVQIRHRQDDGTFLISHYTHLSGVVEGLAEGQELDQGAVIGYVGQGSSSYPHLHFELRRSEDGRSFQRNAVHPLAHLPYEDLSLPTVVLESIDRMDNRTDVSVSISVSRTELDLMGATLEISDAQGLVVERSIDFNEWNASHEDASILDNPDLYGISVSPDDYRDSLNQDWHLRLVFSDIPTTSGPIAVTCKAWDIQGGVSTDSKSLP